MGFFKIVNDKLKEKFKSGPTTITPSGPIAPVGAAPDRRSIYRNRTHFGVNFGSQFVQERFIFDKFFLNDSNTEFEAIKHYIKQNGVDKTREDLNDHWLNYATDSDYEWLRSKGVNAVRIPIGYWHINNGKFTDDTPFESIADVYSEAWDIYKKVLEKAKSHEIGVLVDLHALPNGANTGDHSGIKLESAEFWNDSDNRHIALDIIEFMVKELTEFENVIGLQIVNESVFDNDAASQKKYYTKATNVIRKYDYNIPIIISDGWWPDQWVQWINNVESSLGGQSLGIVIDSHIYRCFDDKDKAKSPEQITNDLDGDALTNLSGSADIIVGEYSHVLDGESWNKADGDKSELVKNYGHQLSSVFKQRANTGTFFWCYKFQHGDGGEWGFVPQVNNGAIPLPKCVQKLPTDEDLNNNLNSEYQAHQDYWKDGQYEHWRYKDGFLAGWSDAVEFARFNGSTIGRKKGWQMSRRLEHINARGYSECIWEWDQGFEKAIEKAQNIIFG